MFDCRVHLESCYSLKARDPEPLHKTGKKTRNSFFPEYTIMGKYYNEVEELIAEGIPPLTSQRIVTLRHAHQYGISVLEPFLRENAINRGLSYELPKELR